MSGALTEVALLLLVVAGSGALGALLAKRRLDRTWRAKLEASERAWARAFARIPKPLRRYTLECILGGRDGAA